MSGLVTRKRLTGWLFESSLLDLGALLTSLPTALLSKQVLLGPQGMRKFETSRSWQEGLQSIIQQHRLRSRTRCRW